MITGDLEQAASGGLREVAVRGAFWSISLTVVNKAITTAGQIVLAWFLVPEDMGLVAMAASAAALATLFTASGIDDLLVQRHQHYAKDAPQVFWIALSFNVLALALVAGLMPFASRHFADQRVAQLMLIQALSWPLSTLPLVVVPKLKIQLRFKALALMNLGEGALFTGAAVLLAALGFGPFSLVWPIVIRVAFAALACRWMGGGLTLQAPRLRLWPAYLGPGLLLMAGNFASIVTTQLPLFIIGSSLGSRLTGLYAWGYLLASQAVFLLAINLRGLFIPLFSKLNGQPDRRIDAILRSLHIITAVVVPVCVLQAFFARPLILLFFPSRWAEAAPVVAWLSLGLIVQPVAIIAHAALIAAGQYSRSVLIALAQSLVIGAGVWLGCSSGDAAHAAMGAALAMTACLPAYLGVIHQVTGRAWSRLWEPSKPLLFGLAAALPAYGVLSYGGPNPPLGWHGAAGATYLLVLVPLALLLDTKLMDHLKSMGLSSLFR